MFRIVAYNPHLSVGYCLQNELIPLTTRGLEMRDNYVGDIGDYVKYGLLRCLSAHTGLRLGVVWYLYPDPCKETDGRHLNYLSPAKEHLYRDCDPELYDKLRTLIANKDRNVAAVRRRSLLPKDTLFFEAPLSLSDLPKGTGKAKLQREQFYASVGLRKPSPKPKQPIWSS